MDTNEPSRRRWRDARTISGLTFVISAALFCALADLTDNAAIMVPLVLAMFVSPVVFILSLFSYRKTTRRFRVAALASILLVCGLALPVLLRETDDRHFAYFLAGAPAILALLAFADAWCKEIGWTQDSNQRWMLIGAPSWITTVLRDVFGVAIPHGAGWPLVLMMLWCVAVLFWPSKRLPPAPPRHGFRSQVIGTYREATDHLGQMVEVPPPSGWQLWISGLVLGSGSPWIIPTIARTFAPDAWIRLHAVVAARTQIVRAIVTITDESGRIVHERTDAIDMRALEILPPPNDPLTGKPAAPPMRQAPAPPPLALWGGAIDIALPLGDLAPGPYTIAVTATAGSHTASHEVAIVVTESKLAANRA